MTERKQSAKEWLFSMRQPGSGEAPYVSLIDAQQALLMAYKEGRQEAAKEIIHLAKKHETCVTFHKTSDGENCTCLWVLRGDIRKMVKVWS